jgi:MFS family permease
MPPADSSDSQVSPASSFAAFRTISFPLFLAGNLCVILGTQMQSTTVYWEVYRRTGDPWYLGQVGLALFLPILVFSLIGGRAADMLNRRGVLIAGLSGLAVASCGLASASLRGAPLWEVYAWLVLSGIARGFVQPSKSSFLPLIVPLAALPNAVAWNMGVFQLASIAGPVLAGVLIQRLPSVGWVYVIDTVLIGVFVVCLLFVKTLAVQKRSAAEPMFESIRTGWRFLNSRKILLAAITLDMFAVLLGGATALFPVFAEDILHVGAEGLGWMRGVSAAGALAMSMVLAVRSPLANGGRNLLWCVAGFGVATILFGVSRVYWLSLLILFVMGALDTVSVVIRHTLVQTLTPDEMRGRVSAINGIFITASNELGAFESGLAAKLFARAEDRAFGPTMAVVTGGMGTIATVLLVARAWPELGKWKEPAE